MHCNSGTWFFFLFCSSHCFINIVYSCPVWLLYDTPMKCSLWDPPDGWVFRWSVVYTCNTVMKFLFFIEMFFWIKFLRVNFYQFRGSDQAPDITVGVAIVFQEPATSWHHRPQGYNVLLPTQGVSTWGVACAPHGRGGTEWLLSVFGRWWCGAVFFNVTCLSP